MPSIHVDDQGHGHAIVLIHGFCENLGLWSEVSKYLVDNYRVIAVDLLGFGKSRPVKGKFSIEDVSRSIHGYLSEINVNSYTCLGHSLGGYVTLSLRALFPESLKAFGLIHSTAFADTDKKKIARNKLVDYIENNSVSKFLESFVPDLFDKNQHLKLEPKIEQVKKMGQSLHAETVINYTLAMRNRKDNTDLLSSGTHKILFVCGLLDKLIPIKDNKEQISMLPDNTYAHVISNAAHMSMYESPLVLKKALTSFLHDVYS